MKLQIRQNGWMLTKKKGISLLEILVYLSLSVVVILLTTSLYIKVQKNYYDNITENKNLNSIAEGLITIETMVKDEDVYKIESTNSNLKLYLISEGQSMIKEIKINNDRLMVYYYKLYYESYYLYGSPNVLIINIKEFYINKKGNLIYLNLKINNENYTKCI